jgi:LytS/YehU family sensor histidine kinase
MGPQYWRPKGEMTEYFSAIPAYLPWIWMALTIPFIFIYQWWKQKSDIANLQKEKYKAELAVLKQQINPHFLFNTLNALYALGIEEKGNKTADGIAKLGTLMRYNLHDAQIDYIDLKKELDYIRKYIGLQQLRITDKDELSVSIMEVEGKQLQIAPMLLLPFIENAFKFGISPTHSTFIRLSIQLNHKQLEMNIANSILKNENKQTGFGMGITNVKKRLNLLYPNQHELTIEKTATTFKVHLSIDLKNLHFNE